MKSDHFTVVRIRLAMEFRGVPSQNALAAMVDIDLHYFHRLMSESKLFLSDDHLKRLADMLVVSVDWLSAPDEAAEKMTAPPWINSLPRAAMKKPKRLPGRPITELAEFESALEHAWREYLALQRSPQDTALRSTLEKSTADGKPWPLFHRTVTLANVTTLGDAFSWVQQHALATALAVPNLPTYEQVMRWVGERIAILIQAAAAKPMEQPATSKRFGQDLLRRAHCPPQEAARPWPLAPTGECFTSLTKRLNKALDGLQTDIQAGKDSATGKSSTPKPDADELRATLRSVFEWQFPDDPRVNLYEAVRQYRAYAKSAAIGDDERAASWPFHAVKVKELLSQFLVKYRGRSADSADLKDLYKATGLPFDSRDMDELLLPFLVKHKGQLVDSAYLNAWCEAVNISSHLLSMEELWEQLLSGHEGKLVATSDLNAQCEAFGLSSDLLSEHINASASEGHVRRMLIQTNEWILICHPSEHLGEQEHIKRNKAELEKRKQEKDAKRLP